MWRFHLRRCSVPSGIENSSAAYPYRLRLPWCQPPLLVCGSRSPRTPVYVVLIKESFHKVCYCKRQRPSTHSGNCFPLHPNRGFIPVGVCKVFLYFFWCHNPWPLCFQKRESVFQQLIFTLWIGARIIRVPTVWTIIRRFVYMALQPLDCLFQISHSTSPPDHNSRKNAYDIFS